LLSFFIINLCEKSECKKQQAIIIFLKIFSKIKLGISLKKELCILSNKAKYIVEVLEGTIDLRRMKKEDIHKMLKEKEYDEMDEFKYLIKMPMDSVSEENVHKIMKEKENKELELSLLMGKTIQEMWLEELEILKSKYLIFQKERSTEEKPVIKVTKKVKTK
jgi:DNA topoisomerase-2